MTWQLLTAFTVGTILGLSIAIWATRRMRRELEEIVGILRR